MLFAHDERAVRVGLYSREDSVSASDYAKERFLLRASSTGDICHLRDTDRHSASL